MLLSEQRNGIIRTHRNTAHSRHTTGFTLLQRRATVGVTCLCSTATGQVLRSIRLCIQCVPEVKQPERVPDHSPRSRLVELCLHSPIHFARCFITLRPSVTFTFQTSAEMVLKFQIATARISHGLSPDCNCYGDPSN